VGALDSGAVTGTHRGGRSWRWRLLVSVATAMVGRGYAGRHRLADAVLGRPLPEQATVVRLATVGTPAASRAASPAATRAASSAAARAVVVPRLTLVPAGASPFTGRTPHRA